MAAALNSGTSATAAGGLPVEGSDSESPSSKMFMSAYQRRHRRARARAAAAAFPLHDVPVPAREGQHDNDGSRAVAASLHEPSGGPPIMLSEVTEDNVLSFLQEVDEEIPDIVLERNALRAQATALKMHYEAIVEYTKAQNRDLTVLNDLMDLTVKATITGLSDLHDADRIDAGRFVDFVDSLPEPLQLNILFAYVRYMYHAASTHAAGVVASAAAALPIVMSSTAHSEHPGIDVHAEPQVPLQHVDGAARHPRTTAPAESPVAEHAGDVAETTFEVAKHSTTGSAVVEETAEQGATLAQEGVAHGLADGASAVVDAAAVAIGPIVWTVKGVRGAVAEAQNAQRAYDAGRIAPEERDALQVHAGIKHGAGAVGGMGGAAAGAAFGAAAGSVIPVAGTMIGAVVGAIVGGMWTSAAATATADYFASDSVKQARAAVTPDAAASPAMRAVLTARTYDTKEELKKIHKLMKLHQQAIAGSETAKEELRCSRVLAFPAITYAGVLRVQPRALKRSMLVTPPTKARYFVLTDVDTMLRRFTDAHDSYGWKPRFPSRTRLYDLTQLARVRIPSERTMLLRLQDSPSSFELVFANAAAAKATRSAGVVSLTAASGGERMEWLRALRKVLRRLPIERADGTAFTIVDH